MRTFFVLVILAACPALGASNPQPAGIAAVSRCIGCHEKVTPGVVSQFVSGKMAKVMDCSGCHGFDHVDEKDVAKAKLPTPETCARCHPERVTQYREGKHSLAWKALKAMPMLDHQGSAAGEESYKGCNSCHRLGERTRWEIKHYGGGACDSCHTRHSFSRAEARDPRTCRTCHMGFDHPQWEMWQTSKHGTIWEIEPNTGRAPTCQTCHMHMGNHAVMTAWGFLALRIPEDDKKWWADRVTILQAVGLLDGKENPTERFQAMSEAKVARLTKEDFARERKKMVTVCSRCHAGKFSEEKLEAADDVIRETDRVFAEAIRSVKGLYDDGILKKPEGWQYAPDLLQFYEAKTSLEQELYLIFLEYRQRAFQGAFHTNPDYQHWYGWAKLKEAAARIREEAGRVRKEGKR